MNNDMVAVYSSKPSVTSANAATTVPGITSAAEFRLHIVQCGLYRINPIKWPRDIAFYERMRYSHRYPDTTNATDGTTNANKINMQS